MSDDDPEIGSVSEEAAKLVGALSDWAKDQGGAGAASGVGASLSGLVDLAREVDAHVAGENCTYCPLCRVIGAVRATSPEVKAHLTTATTALIQAAASAMATHVPPEAQRRSEPVQRIDLDEDLDNDPADQWD
jgi:hypothetical protein